MYIEAMPGGRTRTLLSYHNPRTNATCAVDRFDEVAHVLKDYPTIWTHVDAVYAGAVLTCEEHQHLIEHFEAFDSFDTNMSE